MKRKKTNKKDFFSFKNEDLLERQIESVENLFVFSITILTVVLKEGNKKKFSDEVSKKLLEAEEHKGKFLEKIEKSSLEQKLSFLNVVYYNSRIMTSVMYNTSKNDKLKYADKVRIISNQIAFFYKILMDDIEEMIKLNDITLKNKEEILNADKIKKAEILEFAKVKK